MNEMLISANTYFLFMYTDALVEPHKDQVNQDIMVTAVDTQFFMGWLNIGGFALIFACNLSVILYVSIKGCVKGARARCA